MAGLQAATGAASARAGHMGRACAHGPMPDVLAQVALETT
jgi:hypothetical protein